MEVLNPCYAIVSDHPNQLCGGGTTKSKSSFFDDLTIFVPLSITTAESASCGDFVARNDCRKYQQ
ncbi:hypothetical protein EAF07_03565 [Streptococcus hillyeri]|uniref:Uncharacterized protein n=1 Tax=Streptococcus hillyeri TaxID=2282420 RepID=A0A3L9DZB0_9STRE|nr:hypothetical protein EAF07_03565 [Streptococcus hillyeri]